EDPCPPIERGMCGIPEFVRHDSALRELDLDAIGERASLLGLRTPSVGLPRAIPEDLPAVQLIVEHLADGGRSPAMGAPAGGGGGRAARGAPAGGGDPFGIERLGNARDAPAIRGTLEDAVDHGSLRWIDPSPRGGPACAAAQPGRALPHIVVAVDLAAGNVAV